MIEYKKTKEKGQLSQANRYMMWIRENPAEFELLVRKNIQVKDNIDIDFENPRIICFAQEYNIDDKCLAKALGAELWKYRYYENETLVIVREEEPEQLIKSSPKSLHNKKIKRSKSTKKIRKTKTTEEHLDNSPIEIKNLFESFNRKVINYSSEIEQYTTWQNILYKTSVIFVELNVQKNRLRLLLRTDKGKIDDPKGLAEPVPKSHGWGNLSHIVYLYPGQNMDDVMNLVVQAFKSTQ
ncbi:MAG: hypothetical protein ACQERU_11760 [Bacteroidota bacterium]